MATILKNEITVNIGCKLMMIVYLVKCYSFFCPFQIFKHSFDISCTTCL